VKLNSFLDYFKNKKLHEVEGFDQSDLNLQKKIPKGIPTRPSGRRTPASPYSSTDSRVWMSIPDSQKV